MRKILTPLLALAAYVPAATPAAALPTLQDIIAAHGPVNSIKAYGVRLEMVDIWAYQSPKPDPPWQRSEGMRCDLVDYPRRLHAGYVRRTGAGFYPFHRAHWLGAEQSWEADIYNGWLLPPGERSFRDEMPGTERFAPILMVKRLADAPDSVSGPEAVNEHGALFHYRPPEGEPLQLEFDVRTRLLKILRAGDLSVHYDEYEMVQGYPVSRRMTVSWRGEVVWRLRASTVHFDRPAGREPEPPGGLLRITEPADARARDFRVRELADGVWFAGGGVTYQLFVAFRDFLVALGAVDGVAERLEAVRERAGDKPLRYALVTHHHADHLAGVAELVDAGAVIVASPLHESVIRKAADGRDVQFAFVEKSREISDGQQRLVFREIGPMRHSTRMLAAEVPAMKLLFTADLFVQPPGRPVRAANPPIRDLAEAIERLDLDVTRLVDTHSPVVGNLADLRLAAQTEGDFATREELSRIVCPPQ